jgi:hypothetical protein
VRWLLRAVLPALLFACVAGERATAQQMRLRGDGGIDMSGRALKCAGVRSKLDDALPNLGISVPSHGLLVVNPVLLARQPRTVRLFVFHHECGHHHVGASELGADCWAVRRGVREGWLGRSGLAQVCRSFGGAPATGRYPSAAERCRNLERCFAAASGRRPRPSARQGVAR